MSLKTSFCSKSLIKSDLRRFWWISALHTLLIFLTFVLMVLETIFYARYDTNAIYTDSRLFSNSIPVFLFSVGFPVILGVLLFSYMQSGKASASLHSVPILRRTHFVSHYISGVILFTIPLVINTLILWLFKLDADYASVYRISHVFITMGIAFIYSSLTFSAACAVSMVSGNSIASFVLVYIFGALPAFAEVFITFFLNSQLYGYAYNGSYSITQFLYKTPFDLVYAKYIFFYLGITLAFTIIGYLLYRARKLEKHSEVVAFSKLNPVFVYGVGICSGALGYAYLNGIWECENPLFMIPFGIIGMIIAEMIIKKSFKVFGVYKKLLYYTTFIVVLFSFFHFDLTGYERRVPEVNEIESVIFEQDFGYDYKYAYADGGQIINDYYFVPVIDNPEDIKLVTEYHKALTKERNEQNNNNRFAKFTYKLKNGKSLTREYQISYREHTDVLYPIIDTDIIRQTYFPILRNNERNTVSLQICDDRIENSIFADNDLTNRLLDALKKDLVNADPKEFASRNSTLTYLILSYTRPAHYEDGTPVPAEKLPQHHETYYIRSSYQNTIDVLTEIGFYDSIPKAEDIDAIGVDYYGTYYTSTVRSSYTARNSEIFNYEKVIDDPEEIKEVYEYCIESKGDSYSASSNNLFIDIHLKDGSRFGFDIFIEIENAPKCLLP